ncbi:MAG: radical SAM protein [Dehalococcoidia bacterium]|nr:MAG: radical SAM protein [Dehalococcoidia bacterium]
MGQVQYLERACKQVLNRVTGMPFAWSANPYRGCVHDCQYCFARATHTFLNLAGSQFASVVQVKVNAPEVLRHELRRASWRRERVSVGTATDPYQPIEGRYRLTRRCLEAFADARTPVTIVTKGTLIVRDIDVLQRLRDSAGVTVCLSIPTLDRTLWRTLEPGTPPPDQRLRALRLLTDAGIHAGVLLAPIVPGLTTRDDRLAAVMRAAKAHGARFVSGHVLHLRPGVREHFLAYLAREHPGLIPVYRKLYPGAYVAESFKSKIDDVVRRMRERIGLSGEMESPISPARPIDPVQLSLFAAPHPLAGHRRAG